MPTARLDNALVARGLVSSRSRAQALIMAGEVSVNAIVQNKPSRLVEDADILTITGQGARYVSRAAHKLLHGLEVFGYSPDTAVALDVGASTGGFTQVLLEGGAAHVYAVDVGHGQLAQNLRDDARVTVLEQLNARYLTREHIPRPPAAVVCDASFISLKLVLPAALSLAAPDAWLIVLIKPQFEVGAGAVGKGGIVKDTKLHEAVCADISEWLATQPGWRPEGVTESPITGSDGNREFLLAGRKTA